jgi:uncharacterized protein YbjT (DUF2867 family)
MYVIAGVTGNTGKVVAETLLAAGQKIRVIVRSADKGAPWRARGAEVAVANLDADVDGAAFAGARAAYLLSPPDLGAADPLADVRRRLDGVARLIAKHAVPHVVFLSSLGAQHDKGTGPIVGLHHGENALRAVTSVTAVRAGYFLENWGMVADVARKDGVLPTFLPATLRVPTVHTADIGRVAGEALLAGPTRRVIELTGPMDPTPSDIAAAFSRRLGRKIALAEAPIEAVVPTLTGFGISEGVARLFAEMYAALRNGIVVPEHPSDVVRGRIDLDDGLRRMGV